LTLKVAVIDTPDSEAVSVTLVAVVTRLVVTVNVALVAPAATLTEEGSFAAELDDESVTTKPDGPAALPSVTVPLTTVEDPPITDVGETAKADNVAVVM
jgi:hypothetical protein